MDPRPGPDAASDPGATGLVAAIHAVGADLLGRLIGDQPNVVFSPASLTLAMSLVLEGARARTAEQIAAVLHLGTTRPAAGSAAGSAAALTALLSRRDRTIEGPWDEPRHVMLAVANSLWAQTGYPFDARYLDAVTATHGAGLRSVDYLGAADDARRAINAWVADATRQRIPDLLADGAVDETTRLVVVNTVYLLAAWATPFVEHTTRPEPFTTKSGAVVDVPMMHVLDRFAHVAESGWQAIELPYIGGDLSMLVVLPDADRDLGIATAALTSWLDPGASIAARRTRVRLTMPRFDIETSFDAAVLLAELGMTDVLDPRLADLTGIAAVPDDPLFVSGVIHQANITVDEAGTEAAAATAVLMVGGTRAELDPPVEFRADRPFAFAVRDNPTGTVLFLGCVGDPSRTR